MKEQHVDLNTPTIKSILVLCWCLLLCFSPVNVQGQCTTTDVTIIPDDGVTIIQFSVSGLINNNLSSPAQGICGVEIDFMHEYLGDLTMTLISPAGTNVVLIGPTTTTTNPTNLSRWDIGFIPCLTPASPDPGFADMWSNAQAWQAIASYSGTYHPSSGCLEDFNTGSANGIWQIIIEDHDQFQFGSIASITLIFCDPTGLTCRECDANAGTLSPSSFAICTGTNIQSSAISIDFGGYVPPASLYAYEYLLISGNTILQSGSAFSLTPPAGMYSICGISYLMSDSVSVNNLISASDYNMLMQVVSSGLICAQITSSCIAVDVFSKPDTVRVTGDLCNGEVFSYGGQDYTSTGLFYQIHDGPALCDTVVEIRIQARSLNVMISAPPLLTCINNTGSLTASASGSGSPYTFQWSTLSGNIISPSNNATIMVNQPGQYLVSVTDGICSGSMSVNVMAGPGFPQVLVSGGTITCTNPVVNLNPIYIPSDGAIQWTGPMGFMSNVPDISVTVPGTYIFRVTNQAGCTTSRPVVIGIDTITDDISIVQIAKDCSGGFVTLGVENGNNISTWLWTFPNGIMTNASNPNVSDPGLYTQTATFRNGCTRTTTYLFDADFDLPEIILSPDDTLHCNQTVALSVISGTPGISYTWNGPQGFNSSLPMITVKQKGSYRATVHAPNGCSDYGIVTVFEGDDIFDFEVVIDTLTCKKDTVFIGVNAPEADLFEWLNYMGPDSGLSMIHVVSSGIYTVIMTDTNTNCTITEEIFIPADYTYPHFGFRTDTITCKNPVATLNFIPFVGFNYSTVYWELPDMTVVQGPVLTSSLPGEHRLIGISPIGCVGFWRIHIPFDTMPPFLFLESDTLTCNDTVQVHFQTLDSLTFYQWDGPGIIGNRIQAIDVNKAGIYHLSVFGPNGCEGKHDILVDSNYVIPIVSIMSDSLRCDRPATLVAQSAEVDLNYSWFDPLGQLIGTDSIVQVNQSGLYTIEVFGANKCVAFDTIYLDTLFAPIIQITSDTFTCSRTSAELQIVVNSPSYSIAWKDFNNDTIGVLPQVLVTSAGPFIASVTAANGCVSTDTMLVPYDTLPPIAAIELIGEVRCQMKDVVFDGASSLPAPLLYSWSTLGGMILSNLSLPRIEAYDTGVYQLLVERLDNGCIDTAMFHLTQHPDAITLADINITPSKCAGEGNGGIEIISVSGGIEPISFQLNGGASQFSPVFGGLTSGIYHLMITDAEGCEYDTSITIDPTLLFIVDAGPDQEIYLGESAMLSGSTNLNSADILMNQWDSAGLTLCFDCADFEVTPWETTMYEFQVISSTGCIRSDQVIVYVIEKAKYFIPNIFSPNGDQMNDEIRFHPTPGVAKVLKWIIFDRWGDAVFGKIDFDPADAAVFWDGRTSTGEFSNPGVFPYLIEIQLINGRRELHHGNITLLR